MRTIFEAAPLLEAVIIIGGPPCQDFSVVGLQKGFAGMRGQMIVVTARLIARAKELLAIAAASAALAYLVENLASMERHIRDKVS